MAYDDLPSGKYSRALALRNLLVATSEGPGSSDDSDYRLLRREFMLAAETAELVPQFVLACSDLHQFWAFIKDQFDRWEHRRRFIREEFAPLLAQLAPHPEDGNSLLTEDGQIITTQDGEPIVAERAGQTEDSNKSAAPFLTLGGSVVTLGGEPVILGGAGARELLGEPEISEGVTSESSDSFQWTEIDPPLPEESNAIQSSSWTGKITVQQQARLIISFAPAALLGVQAMLREQEERLHNGPPEAIGRDDLQSLRDLHQSLGTLIQMAEGGESLDGYLGTIKGLLDKVFGFAVDTGELCVAGAKPLLASVPAAWGTWVLLSMICNPATFAALGPLAASAVTAGYFGMELKNRPKKS